MPFDIRHYSKSLSCLLFLSLPVISLESTSIQILFDWCEHYFCHNISWTCVIDTMIKWNDYLLFFSQEALSKFDAIMDGTYTDAEDICEHQAPGWHQKYYLTFRTTHRCSFFSTYHLDYDSTKPHSHPFTYQLQYKLINILYDTKLQPNLKCSLHVKVYDTKSTMKWNQFSGKMKACTKWNLFWGCC